MAVGPAAATGYRLQASERTPTWSAHMGARRAPTTPPPGHPYDTRGPRGCGSTKSASARGTEPGSKGAGRGGASCRVWLAGPDWWARPRAEGSDTCTRAGIARVGRVAREDQPGEDDGWASRRVVFLGALRSGILCAPRGCVGVDPTWRVCASKHYYNFKNKQLIKACY